jgi:hypothetical protein
MTKEKEAPILTVLQRGEFYKSFNEKELRKFFVA